MPSYTFGPVRAAIYRAIGLHLGPHVSFATSIRVVGRGSCSNLSIDEGSIIAADPLFNLEDKIRIGRNVSVGPSVAIYTSTHQLGPASRRMSQSMITSPVIVEDGAWICAGSIILPGVVIGRGSVVSAGSVVTANVPPNTLVVGNPAKVVRELPLPDR
jgi:maltose O-acetyltransferase